MIRGQISLMLSSLSVVAAVAFAATSAQAGSTRNGAASTAFPQFTYEADAVKQCGNDQVVWGSSRQPGVYFAKGTGPQRVSGFYACAAAATKAGMQIKTGG
jgi:hypothetical protein